MSPQQYTDTALKVRLYHETEISPLFSKILYLSCGLIGETGEFTEKVKKIIRDKECVLSKDDKFLIASELADIFWYFTAITDEMGLTLDQIMKISVNKIQSRIERGVLQGNGDGR